MVINLPLEKIQQDSRNEGFFYVCKYNLNYISSSEMEILVDLFCSVASLLLCHHPARLSNGGIELSGHMLLLPHPRPLLGAG